MARSKGQGSTVRRFVRSNRTATGLKLGLTAAAFGAAAYSNVLGRRISDARAFQLADESVSPDIEVAIRRQSVLRWVMPALSGSLVLLGAIDRNRQQSTGRVARAIDRFAPDLDKLTPEWDRITPALDRIGPAIERITPEWAADRLPSLAS